MSRRGLNPIRITRVRGHADDEMIPLGARKQVDKDGDVRTDEAADLGRRHVGFSYHGSP